MNDAPVTPGNNSLKKRATCYVRGHRQRDGCPDSRAAFVSERQNYSVWRTVRINDCDPEVAANAAYELDDCGCARRHWSCQDARFRLNGSVLYRTVADNRGWCACTGIRRDDDIAGLNSSGFNLGDWLGIGRRIRC